MFPCAVRIGGRIAHVKLGTGLLEPVRAREETLVIDPATIQLRSEVERWFLELRDPVFRYLCTLRCRRALAEEISQEVFLRLHRALHNKVQVGDVRAWVFRVALNLYIDQWRDDQRYGTAGREDGRRPRPARGESAPDPEQQLLQRERRRQIAENVAGLPPLQRRCLRLKAQGLRYHEIAEALGVSRTVAVDCVRQAVKRVGRRLRD